MSRHRDRFLITAMALSFGTVCAQTESGPSKPPVDQEAFFGLDKLWDVHIEVPSHGWDAMHPSGTGYRARFPYAKATVRVSGLEPITVGLRFKGNSTYWKLPRGTLKKSFKLDFDRHLESQTFLGLKKLNLHNNHYDDTQLREALSHRAYRKSALPSARTAFARVYLTIRGRAKRWPYGEIENRFLGVYTLVEQVDRSLLKRQTGHKGALLKPDGKVLPYLGEEWDENYDRAYGSRTEIGEKAGRAVIGLAKVLRAHASSARDEKARRDFKKRLEDVLDVDAFLRYLAVTVLIGNGDNWLFMGSKNYYLAVSDQTSLVSVLAWDLNNSLGGMGKFTGRNFEDLSILRPSQLPWVATILEVPAFKERYLAIVRELISGPCSAARMSSALEVAEKTVVEAIAEEARVRGKRVLPEDLPRFFAAREKSVLDQLSGRSRGVEFGSRASKSTKHSVDLKTLGQRLKAAVQAGEMTEAEAISEYRAAAAAQGAQKKRQGKKRPVVKRAGGKGQS